MERSTYDFDRITDQFAVYLKMNTAGTMVLGTRKKEIREPWKALNERTRVGAKLKALIRVTKEVESLHTAMQRKYREK